jgi:hypothetical protein
VARLKSSLRTFYGRKHDFVASYGISVTHDHWYVPLVIKTIWFSFMTYYRIWNKNTVTRQIPLVGQDILTLPEHPWLTPVFSGVCVSQSKVFCVVFFYYCSSCCHFSFWRYIVCPSSMTVSDNNFIIFKLFFSLSDVKIMFLVTLWCPFKRQNIFFLE